VTAELSNPATAGLIAGVVLWAAQLIWNKVMGGPTERSIPVQLLDISSRLTEISSKLEIAINNYQHLEKEFAELKKDFWDHMKDFHSHQGGS
jgi:hypothetical protein